MKTAILTIGTEILFGQIVNTNTVFLSRELNDMGFDVLYHHTVGDNEGRLAELMEEIFRSCDLIITTGGLGPTEDDLTKETAARVLHDRLVRHEESLVWLEDLYRSRGWNMTANTYKQVMMPSRALVFPNSCGTAPGFLLSENGKMIACMPGPPKEMKAMWADHVRPYLEQFSNEVIRYRIIRTYGIGEPSLETCLLPLIDGQTDPTIATYAKEGECSVRIASKRASAEEADRAIDEMTDRVMELLGDLVYSKDNEELYQVVGKMLIETNTSISCCESCTGGLFASTLVKVPGISAVFDRGIVTYSERAKTDELGVPPELIAEKYAESPEVALAMAAGLKKKTGSRICVSSTGVAGPGPYHGLPAGTIFIGLAWDEDISDSARWMGYPLQGMPGVRQEVIRLDTVRDERETNKLFTVLRMFDSIRKILR